MPAVKEKQKAGEHEQGCCVGAGVFKIFGLGKEWSTFMEIIKL